jgi:hypothetical protein
MTDAKKIVVPDELLIPDTRAGLSPRELVEGKLLRALRAEARTPGDGTEQKAPRRPMRDWQE